MARIGNEKISFIIIAVLCVMCTVLLFGVGIQTARLESSLAECRQYREKLESAENRESEIRESLSRTGVILNSTGNEVANLRTKLEALEENYNYLYNMYCVDNNTMESN